MRQRSLSFFAASAHQIKHGLRIQQKFLTAALVVLLSLSGMSAPSVLFGMMTSKKLAVSATVLPSATVKVLSQPQELVVTNSDISRGYAEVRSAVRIEVKNNSLAGYLLVFEGTDMPFREMHVQGLGTDVRINPGGGWISQPYMPGTSTLELGFKFILTEDSRPGTYQWPLAMSVRPL